MDIIIRSRDKISGTDANFTYNLNFTDANLYNKKYILTVNNIIVEGDIVGFDENGVETDNAPDIVFYDSRSIGEASYEVEITGLTNITTLDGTEQSKISFFMSELKDLNHTISYEIPSLNRNIGVRILDMDGNLRCDNSSVDAQVKCTISLRLTPIDE